MFLTAAVCLTLALTGVDFGDPSPPRELADGQVEVLTTGGEVLTWSDWDQFFAARTPRHSRLKLYHPDGTPLEPETRGEDGWDPAIEDGVLYAGVMSFNDSQWPEDHWSRRTYAFENKNGRWIRREESLLGPVPSAPTWIGHNYGHSILEWRGRRYFFYEKVVEERGGQPWRTDLFARRMRDRFTLEGPEIEVLNLREREWPQVYRSFGGKLAEGPRAFVKDGRIHVSFSAGEYMSDDYGIHLLVADKIEGPYRAMVTNEDLIDLGQPVDDGMSWGAARAAFFARDGEWFALFHGVPHGMPDGFRQVCLAQVRD